MVASRSQALTLTLTLMLMLLLLHKKKVPCADIATPGLACNLNFSRSPVLVHLIASITAQSDSSPRQTDSQRDSSLTGPRASSSCRPSAESFFQGPHPTPPSRHRRPSCSSTVDGHPLLPAAAIERPLSNICSGSTRLLHGRASGRGYCNYFCP